MAMTLRLDDDDLAALRDQADREGRSMHDVIRQAVADYLDRAGRRSRIDRIIDDEVPRYRRALDRLGE
jgi:predicted transcriptional regulator